ncbi:MAG: sulfotransferase domain-containing protein [Alphaproteobacteria bacterium]|nr:sulfotransferase domain-containing protein [Alphaproteobacteria bacterium]
MDDPAMGGLLFDKNFALSIGPQRAGSGWIDRYLRSRGDVCLPSHVKEIFYFDRHFERGPDFYYSHFNYLPSHRLGIEITTTAFDHREAPQRVFSLFGGGLKLICPLRHPVERSYSLYQHFLRYGIVTGGLAEAVEQAPQILYGSRYAQHLEVWYRFFPPAQITLLYQEALEEDPEAYVAQLCESLGLPYIAPPEGGAGGYNVTGVSRFHGLARTAEKAASWLTRNGLDFPVQMARKAGLRQMIFGPEAFDAKRQSLSREDHEWLSVRLVPEIEKLEALLGQPITVWRTA